MRFLLAALLLIASPAWAQYDHDICTRITHHVPVSDVAHKPGAEDVVPADLRGSLDGGLGGLDIPIEINLAELSGNEFLPDDLQVATVSLFQDGRVEYNGQDVSRSVSAACEAAEDVPVEDGQSEEKLVPSEPENTESLIEGQYPIK